MYYVFYATMLLSFLMLSLGVGSSQPTTVKDLVLGLLITAVNALIFWR